LQYQARQLQFHILLNKLYINNTISISISINYISIKYISIRVLVLEYWY